jgi:6-phosphogluconate dehydrogenase
MPATSQICLVGQAVMGRNLSLNLLERGVAVTLWDREFEATEATMREVRPEWRAFAARTPEEAVASLQRPRALWLMVRAGAPVDATIERFLPFLEPGDTIVDGGNSHPDETDRRTAELAARGLHFVGMGVSGGEEGARHGPSLMPGGDPAAYATLRPMLEKIAAKVEDGPCVTHIGTGSAGHFVKMVHNGIEYGDMQLIAECYDLMQNVLGMAPPAMAETFARWNQGPLESFLVEITARILRNVDPTTSQPMVDVIVDRAGQKGTGRWTSEMALRYGVPAPTLQAAVEARYLSARKDERVQASERLRGPNAPTRFDASLLEAIGEALFCSKICSYAQGIDLLATADRERGWGLRFPEIARIWKGGCIIRARFLAKIQAAYSRNPALTNLLLDPEVGSLVETAQAAWRRVVAVAAEHGVPTLAMSSALAYFDSYRRARLPQNLTQAQRDLFGAHTFERVDAPAGRAFHHDWT